MKKRALQVRMNEADYESITGMAEASGVSMSEFCRRRLLAPGAAQEASEDEQARKTSGSDAALQGASGADCQEVESQAASKETGQDQTDHKISAVRLQNDNHVLGAGHEASGQVLGGRPFRVSAKCAYSDSRCERLSMALCEPCREENS